MRLILNPYLFSQLSCPSNKQSPHEPAYAGVMRRFLLLLSFPKLVLLCFCFPKQVFVASIVALVMKASFGEGFCKKQAVRNVIFVLCTFALR